MVTRHEHASSAISKKLASQQAGAMLWSVNVNKAAAGQTLTIYDAEDATVASKIVCQIDLTNVGSWWYAQLCNAGIYYVVSGGTPDITIGFS